jgi:hypothetical protein
VTLGPEFAKPVAIGRGPYTSRHDNACGSLWWKNVDAPPGECPRSHLQPELYPARISVSAPRGYDDPEILPRNPSNCLNRADGGHLDEILSCSIYIGVANRPVGNPSADFLRGSFEANPRIESQVGRLLVQGTK